MPMASTAQAGSGASQRRAPAEEAQAAREGWAQAAVATRRRMTAQRTSAGMLTTWVEAVGCCSARAAWAAEARREVRRQLTPTPRATAMIGGTVEDARRLPQAAGRPARSRGRRRMLIAWAPFSGRENPVGVFSSSDWRPRALIQSLNSARCAGCRVGMLSSLVHITKLLASDTLFFFGITAACSSSTPEARSPRL